MYTNFGPLKNTLLSTVDGLIKDKSCHCPKIVWILTLLSWFLCQTFISFLFDKSVILLLNGFTGPIRHCLEFGLPQGAVLSPLLFRFYVSDLDQVASLYADNVDFFKFADDGTAQVKGKDMEECLGYLHIILGNLDSWASKWRMVVNCDKDKTEVICFNSLRNDDHDAPDSFSLGTNTIYLTNQSKVLGVVLDKDLNYRAHSNVIYNRLIYRWTKICQYCNRNWGINQHVTMKIVNTVMLSSLFYASTVWLTSRNIDNINKLWYRICKSAVGAVFNVCGSALEIILGSAPLDIQNRVISVKHYLKSFVNCPDVSDKYMSFLGQQLEARNPIITAQFRDVFRFLNWKLAILPEPFSPSDSDLIRNRKFSEFWQLSHAACMYTRPMMRLYMADLWKTYIENRQQSDSWDRIPNISCDPIKIPLGTKRVTEVIYLSFMYKNNLLNSFLNHFNSSLFPTHLCACTEDEETAFHIITECPLVKEETRKRVVELLTQGNKVLDGGELVPDHISIMNCSRDSRFISLCLEIIETSGINFRSRVCIYGQDIVQ